MTNYIRLAYTPSRVKTAGKRFRDGVANLEDSIVLENWRASHSYVLNTFQSNLRKRARGKNITVAQRLKRRPTIIDKLRREPSMQLNTMHDLAGCRVIFEDVSSLRSFRNSMLFARFKHALKSVTYETIQNQGNSIYRIMRQLDRYNYIDKPKDSGYRGIHDVYQYYVRSHGGKQWNGLHIEIQYRTIHQHAWATAVEVADLVTASRIKFSQSDVDHREFFRITSEMIARSFEGLTGCLPLMTDHELVNGLREIDSRLGLLSTFKHIKTSERRDVFRTNSLLIFHTAEGEFNGQLDVETYDNINEAIERYEQLERELSGKADVVLVRADNEDSMRLAFRNYFSDTVDFVNYVEGATEFLNNRNWRP